MTGLIQEQLDQYLALSRKPLLLRFAAELEARFNKREYEVKKREILIISIIGGLMIDLLLFSDFAIDPAHIWRAVIIRLGIFTPCAASSIVINYCSPQLWVRETSKAVTLAITGACVLAVLSNGSDVNVLICQMGLLLVVAFAMLILRLRLPYAMLATLCILLEEAVFLYHEPGWQGSLKMTYMFVVAFGSSLSLLTTRRLEAGERISYLLLLREEARNQQLATLNHSLTELSNVDALTGLSNRRYFDQQLESLWAQGRQASLLVSILMVDIDHFKRLNDSFGHLNGDKVLIALAKVLRDAVRAGIDTVARFGGEEFVIVLPGIDQALAFQIAERIRLHVSESVLQLIERAPPVTITISCGVATACLKMPHEATELLKNADKALYHAKHTGRNRVCLASPSQSSTMCSRKSPHSACIGGERAVCK